MNRHKYINLWRAWVRFHRDYLAHRKLKFATWWDNINSGKYCWADCVSWAFSPEEWNPFKISSSKGCEIESIEHEHESCYCGGWNKGVCFSLLSTDEQKKIRDSK